MKTYYFILLFLGILFAQSVNSQTYKSDSWASVKASGSGTLYVVYPEQQPGLIENKNGKLLGLCVNILQDFANYVQTKYNKKVKIQYAPKGAVFSDFLSIVQNNKNVLGVGSIAITSKRKKILKYTPPFMYNKVSIVTHKDVPTVSSSALLSKTLKGYSAEILARSSHEGYIKKIKMEHWPDMPIVYGKSLEGIVKKISAKSKTFTVVNLTQFIDLNRRHVSVKRHPIDLGDNSAKAFIMSKQSDWDLVWKEFLTKEYLEGSKYRKNVLVNLGAAYLAVSKGSK